MIKLYSIEYKADIFRRDEPKIMSVYTDVTSAIVAASSEEEARQIMDAAHPESLYEKHPWLNPEWTEVEELVLDKPQIVHFQAGTG